LKLKSSNPNKFYYRVRLYHNGKSKKFMVHLLVLECFGPKKPTPKHEVNHKDGVKIHNWIDNLEWLTRSENKIHAIKLGLCNPKFPVLIGEKNGRAKLTEKKVIRIKKYLKHNKLTQREIAEMFNVTRMLITAINNNRLWRSINV